MIFSVISGSDSLVSLVILLSYFSGALPKSSPLFASTGAKRFATCAIHYCIRLWRVALELSGLMVMLEEPIVEPFALIAHRGLGIDSVRLEG